MTVLNLVKIQVAWDLPVDYRYVMEREVIDEDSPATVGIVVGNMRVVVKNIPQRVAEHLGTGLSVEDCGGGAAAHRQRVAHLTTITGESSEGVEGQLSVKSQTTGETEPRASRRMTGQESLTKTLSELKKDITKKNYLQKLGISKDEEEVFSLERH